MMMLGLLLLGSVVLVGGAIAVLVWLNRTNQRGNPSSSSSLPENREQVAGPDAQRFCSHCGAGLQASWAHCPQCGAPTGS